MPEYKLTDVEVLHVFKGFDMLSNVEFSATLFVAQEDFILLSR